MQDILLYSIDRYNYYLHQNKYDPKLFYIHRVIKGAESFASANRIHADISPQTNFYSDGQRVEYENHKDAYDKAIEQAQKYLILI